MTVLRYANGAIGKVASVVDSHQPYYLRVYLVGRDGTILDGKLWSDRIAGLDPDRWTELGVKLESVIEDIDDAYTPQFQEFYDALNDDREMAPHEPRRRRADVRGGVRGRPLGRARPDRGDERDHRLSRIGISRAARWGERRMASYAVNKRAVAKMRQLIDAHQYVLDSVWGDAQPSADDENAFLETHSWDEYAAWHLGLTEGPGDDTKARYAFVVGDFRRVHRSGLIACQYRAAEWRHKAVELAAHELLQHLDNTRA